MTPAAKKPAKSKPSEYVVLERLDGADLGDIGEAWTEMGRATSVGKTKAIDEVVGNREGTFRAVALSSWKGGVVRAQTTLMESKPLEEANDEPRTPA